MTNYSYEQRMRLKFNMYSYSTAYKRLTKAIEENNDHEIYAAIGELLLWVMTTHEWHKEHGAKEYQSKTRSDKRGMLLYGLAHAYNSMKHNMKLVVMHNKEEGFSFEKMDFSNFDFRPFKFCWIKAGNLLEGKYPDQKKNYIEFIEGKEVLKTFQEVLSFLNRENQHILFKRSKSKTDFQ